MTVTQSEPNLHLVLSDLQESERALINQQLVNKLCTKLLTAKINFLTHKRTARLWKKVDLGLNLFNTIFAAISGTSALSSSNNTLITGGLSLIVAVLTAINTFLKPSNNSKEHLQFAARYTALRNEIDFFLSQNCIQDKGNQYRIAQLKVDSFTEELRQSIEELIGKFNELEEKAPMPFDWVTKQAQWEVIPASKEQSKHWLCRFLQPLPITASPGAKKN
jgi:hypothetical protein